MRILSNTPKMAYSKPMLDIPLGLVTTLKALGHHELEIEDVAPDFMLGDWHDQIGDLF